MSESFLITIKFSSLLLSHIIWGVSYLIPTSIATNITLNERRNHQINTRKFPNSTDLTITWKIIYLKTYIIITVLRSYYNARVHNM